MTLMVQFYAIIAMIAMGIWLGIAVDTYSRFMHPNRWTWLLFLCDIFFWIVQALLIFYILLQVNEGELRIYIFLALLCGFAAYRALIQAIYLHLLEKLIRIGRTVSLFIKQFFHHVIFRPLRLLIRLLLSLFLLIWSSLLTMAVFFLKFWLLLIKGIGRGIWRLMPRNVQEKLNDLAGLVKQVQKKIMKWFARK